MGLHFTWSTEPHTTRTRLVVMADLKPAYLVHGDDEVKLDSWRARLRARAATEGPSATLDVLAGDRLTPGAFAEATGSLTLAVGRRYVLADGVERWKEKDLGAVVEALKSLPPDSVVLMLATGKVSRGKGPASESLVKAVRALGGEVQLCEAPRPAKLPGWVVEQGADLGLVVSEDGAHALVERVGNDQRRLVRELEKLACYEPDGGRVDRDAVEALTVSDLEARAYELGDAVIEGDAERALRLAEDLRERGEEMMHIVFAMLRQLRQARRAVAMLEQGASTQELSSALRVPPFIAKQIAARAGRADAAALERALDDLAELDYTVRGGGNVDPGTALTLALAGA
jgi:DNA polymerase-3 subunit delta